MARISKLLRSSDDGRGGHGLLFYCAGCKMAHKVNIGDGPGPRWGYNGNADKPTFTPSVLVTWSERDVPKVCHTFVTDGRIQYLSDCTHELAGQTIDLPPFAWGEDDAAAEADG